MMKRWISVALLLMFLPTIALADSVQSNDPILSTEEERLYQEMERRSAIALQEIEDNKEAIDAEIATNQAYYANQPGLYGVEYDQFKYMDGDILITKNTSSDGITGHAGIIVGKFVLDTTNSGNKKRRVLTLSEWYSLYPSTTVLRYRNGRDIPVKAAWYGKTFYIDGDGQNNTYSSTLGGPYSYTHDYCSSLVWKCYARGANFNHEFMITNMRVIKYGLIDPIPPYEYIAAKEHNQFDIILKKNW